MHRPDHAPAADAPAPLLGDGRALRDILALAGPDMAPRLLRQIVSDLSEIETRLAPALATRDWLQIRASSHVLISLAGTIGAMDLHAAAVALNESAHAHDATGTARLAARVLPDLAALITLVSAFRDGKAAP